MLTALIIVFVISYAAIALEHPLKINKSASALVGAGLLWTIYALSVGDAHLELLVRGQLRRDLFGQVFADDCEEVGGDGAAVGHRGSCGRTVKLWLAIWVTVYG